MEIVNKYLISLGITFGLIFTLSFFINLLNYFEVLNTSLFKIIITITGIISIAVGAFILGKKSLKKGYLEGIKFGFLTCLLMFIISYLAFDSNIFLESLIYYLILIFTSCIASTIGINKKTLAGKS